MPSLHAAFWCWVSVADDLQSRSLRSTFAVLTRRQRLGGGYFLVTRRKFQLLRRCFLLDFFPPTHARRIGSLPAAEDCDRKKSGCPSATTFACRHAIQSESGAISSKDGLCLKGPRRLG